MVWSLETTDRSNLSWLHCQTLWILKASDICLKHENGLKRFLFIFKTKFEPFHLHASNLTQFLQAKLKSKKLFKHLSFIRDHAKYLLLLYIPACPAFFSQHNVHRTTMSITTWTHMRLPWVHNESRWVGGWVRWSQLGFPLMAFFELDIREMFEKLKWKIRFYNS